MSNTEVYWHYVGHYGQLGPLTFDQFVELIHDGVIERETYVWTAGMPTWQQAGIVPQLSSQFTAPPSGFSPPPFDPARSAQPSIPPAPAPVAPAPFSMPVHGAPIAPYASFTPTYAHEPMSDKSRIAAGVLNILIPGVGRMYLGHVAHGIMQLVLSFCVVGWFWSVLDGILMLTGNVRYDGYGRRLRD